MKIDNGFKGDERRKCSKLKLTTGDWIRAIVLFAAVVSGFVRTEMTVRANSKELIKVENLPTQMAVMQNDITDIRGDIQDVKGDVNNIKKNVMKILEKL